MESIRQITVIGGGNIGTQFACVCAAKGYAVNIYTENPGVFSHTLQVIGDTPQESWEGCVQSVTDDLHQAVEGSQVVFVTYPAFLLEKIAMQLQPLVTAGLRICVLPGTGGAEFAFRGCLEKGAQLFGLQRVPGVARLVQPGKSVRVKGLRGQLHLAAIPQAAGTAFGAFLEELFSVPCQILPNYLAITLTPSNPILHTTRLCTMFADYAPGVSYDRQFLFYQEWTDAASELLLRCDEQLQGLCRQLEKKTGLDLTAVRPLQLHYESDTPQALTTKLRGIAGFAGLPAPMVRQGDGWIPDFQDRYFSADFAYGLAILVELAQVAQFPCPALEQVLSWYTRVSGNTARFTLAHYGIHTLQDIKGLYMQ